jgi:hypothetical protein
MTNLENPWNKFKEKLNQFGSLGWNIEPLQHTTNFLDLILTIKNKQITTTTSKNHSIFIYTYHHYLLIHQVAFRF